MSVDQIVRDVLAQVLDAEEDELTLDAVLADIDAWDSVNGLRVLVFLERELGTSLSFDSYLAAHTVGEICAVAAAATAGATTGVAAGATAGRTSP